MIEIRPARLSDVGAVKAFADLIRAEGLPYFLDRELPEDQIRETIQLAVEGADLCALVAEKEGALIGTVTCCPLPQAVRGFTHEASGVLVRADMRRMGLGGKLLDRALAWAHYDSRVDGLCGEILETNDASIRLVESRGFWSADRKQWPGGPREAEVPGHGRVPILVYCRETPGGDEPAQP